VIIDLAFQSLFLPIRIRTQTWAASNCNAYMSVCARAQEHSRECPHSLHTCDPATSCRSYRAHAAIMIMISFEWASVPQSRVRETTKFKQRSASPIAGACRAGHRETNSLGLSESRSQDCTAGSWRRSGRRTRSDSAGHDSTRDELQA